MIRRVFLSTLNYDHPQKGMRHAFEGIFGRENVGEFDYYQHLKSSGSKDRTNAAFFEAARAFAPDWVWLQVQNTDILTARSIERLREAVPGCVVSHWMGDLRRNVEPYLASICKVSHLTLTASEGQLPLFLEAGAPRAAYCQIGLDWEEDVLGLPSWQPPFRVPDVVFCGNYYADMFPGTLARVAAIQGLMAAGIDIGIVGSGWPKWAPVIGSCHVKQQHHIWRRTKVALSVNHFNDIHRYWSDRQIIAMASGAAVVCYRIPGLEKDFQEGQDCLAYSDPQDLVGKVGMLLRDEAARVKLAAAGRAKVMRNHTWFNRILDLLPVVEEMRPKVLKA